MGIDTIVEMCESNDDVDVEFVVNCIIPKLSKDEVIELETQLQLRGWIMDDDHLLPGNGGRFNGLWNKGPKFVRTRNLKKYLKHFNYSSWSK